MPRFGLIGSSLVRRWVPLALFLVGVGVFGRPYLFAQDTPVRKTDRRVLVISLDGLDARYVNDPDRYGLKIPTLRKLMREGVTAAGVRSVYPSITYPNHTSMVTGAFPEKHGIFGNDVFQPPTQSERGPAHWFARDIKAHALWDAAKENNLTVGLVSWPVGGGVGDYNVPEIWQPGGTPTESLERVRENSLPAGLFDEIRRGDADLFTNSTPDEQDDSRTRFAEFILREKRPDLMLVHLFDLDHLEHKYGPFSPEVFAVLERVDGYVARLIAAAGENPTVAIVSDHGFRAVTRQINPGVALAKAGLITVNRKAGKDVVSAWRAAPYVTGAACAIRLRDDNDAAALKKARDIFDPRKNPGIARLIEREELKRLGSNTTAALMLEAAEGYTFGNRLAGDYATPATVKGMHGYLPSTDGYRAAFIVAGPGVAARGTIAEIDMPQVGTTLAKLLGVTLRDAAAAAVSLDGRNVTGRETSGATVQK